MSEKYVSKSEISKYQLKATAIEILNLELQEHLPVSTNLFSSGEIRLTQHVHTFTHTSLGQLQLFILPVRTIALN